jgi:two-component system, OmpR family, response regulator
MSERIRILIVDDEERFRSTLIKLLSSRGMQAAAAGSGEEALELLEGQAFDVILLDVKMPGMGGVKALPRIKELRPEAEVLVLTGHASVDIASEMIRNGAADYLLKPCPLDELLDGVRAAFDRSRTRKLASGLA